MKNMTSLTLLILSTLLIFGISGFRHSSEAENPARSESDNLHTWRTLFNGTSIDQWRGYNMDQFPESGWQIEEDELVLRPVDGVGGVDLITRETFRDFELTLEYNNSEGGNSGIMHHVIEQPGIPSYLSGPEFQILDDPAYENLNDTQYSASLYDMIPANPKNTRPAGEWNSVRILSDGARMEYWQNGEKVVEFERWTAEWFSLVRNSKFECNPSFGNVPEGHIALQDHGNAIRFRNIQIRRLD